MPTLGALIRDRATVSIEFPGGESLSVTYRPGALTVASMADMRAALKASDGRRLTEQEQGLVGMGSIPSMLADLIESWDLTDEDGAPIPTDADALARLPMGVLNLVMSGVMADIQGNQNRPPS